MKTFLPPFIFLSATCFSCWCQHHFEENVITSMTYKYMSEKTVQKSEKKNFISIPELACWNFSLENYYFSSYMKANFCCLWSLSLGKKNKLMKRKWFFIHNPAPGCLRPPPMLSQTVIIKFLFPLSVSFITVEREKQKKAPWHGMCAFFYILCYINSTADSS